MQRSRRPKDNSVNNSERKSRIEENQSVCRWFAKRKRKKSPDALCRATTQPLDPFDPTFEHVPLIDTAIKRTNSNVVTANTSCSQRGRLLPKKLFQPRTTPFLPPAPRHGHPVMGTRAVRASHGGASVSGSPSTG